MKIRHMDMAAHMAVRRHTAMAHTSLRQIQAAHMARITRAAHMAVRQMQAAAVHSQM